MASDPIRIMAGRDKQDQAPETPKLDTTNPVGAALAQILTELAALRRDVNDMMRSTDTSTQSRSA